MGRFKHKCHAVDCEVVVPERMLMCKAHWAMVSKRTKQRVYIFYRVGQERDKNPSKFYLEAAGDAIREVAKKEDAIACQSQKQDAQPSSIST